MIWMLWSVTIVTVLALVIYKGSRLSGKSTWNPGEMQVISANIEKGEHVPENAEKEPAQELVPTGAAVSEESGNMSAEDLIDETDKKQETTESTAEPEEQPEEQPEEEDDTHVQERLLDPERPMVALTFDDGPYRNNTKAITDLFEQYDGRATFFVVGYHLEMFAEDMLYAHQRGFQIGNHTLNHPALRQMSDEEAMNEIQEMNRRLNELGIPGEVMLRPPYGEYTQYIQEHLNVPMIGWNVDSQDWLSKDADKIYEQIVGNVTDGDIVLLHDLHDVTAEAMQRVVPELVAQGFQLVTVEELFKAKGITPQAGEYYCYIR